MFKKLLLSILFLFGIKAFSAEIINYSLNSADMAVLSNFRIENSNKDRVYFDSNVPLNNSNPTINGFVISGKTIKSVKINTDQKIGHYFIVSSPFTFWDNNTIEYSGGSNINCVQFSISYVKNNIKESFIIKKELYVSIGGDDSNLGVSQSKPLRTIAKALELAQPGTKVWIEAGNYEKEILNFNKSGKLNYPIVLEGYKKSPGDVKNLYYNYGDGDLDPKELPMLNGGDRGKNRAIELNNSSFWVFKNIQITNYKEGVKCKTFNSAIFENILIKDMGDYYNPGLGLYLDNPQGIIKNIRIKNSKAINVTSTAFLISSTNGLIEGCEAYCDEAKNLNDGHLTTDYYYVIRGYHNIIRNNHAEKKINRGHNGHGFTIKIFGEKNLIEKCTAVNIFETIAARHRKVSKNVFKDCYGTGGSNRRVGSGHYSGGITLFAGGNNNLFERIKIEDADAGIIFIDNAEDGGATFAGNNNIIRNCVFNNLKTGIMFSNANYATSYAKDNIIENSIFNNIKSLVYISKSKGEMKMFNNKFINNSFSNIDSYYRKSSELTSGLIFDTNNFYKSFIPKGSNATKFDPQYFNENNGDFRLKSTSKLIDAGKESSSNLLDINNVPRPQGNGIDIGAHEYKSAFMGSVTPNLSICEGEEVVLVASGGNSYVWNTGEVVSSIKVRPKDTTTYTVTITDDNGVTEKRHVTVTVDNAPSVSLVASEYSICEGDSVTLTATGEGDFTWSTGESGSSIEVSPTSTAKYTVTASNSCSTSATADVTIIVSEAIDLSVSDDVSICSGEVVTLTATGNGDFTWSTGEISSSIDVSPTTTTTYMVTSSNANCSLEKTVTVTVNNMPSVSLVASEYSICEGDSVILTAVGNGDFTWSTGETGSSIEVSPISTTKYTVTANNSCSTSATAEVDVVVNSLPTLSTIGNVTIKKGETVTLTSNGEGNFLWNTGEETANINVAPEVTTTYNVSLTSLEGGCSVDEDITVTVIQPVVSTIQAYAGEDITVCKAEKVILKATGGDSYLWSTGENTPNIEIEAFETKLYSVKVYKGNSYKTAYVTVYIDDSCEEDISSSEASFSVYPNPVNNTLNINLVGYRDDVKISVVGVNGSVLETKRISNVTTDRAYYKIGFSRFAKGVYFIKLLNKGNMKVKKVLRI